MGQNFDPFSLIFALFAALQTPYTAPNIDYFVLFVQIVSYCYESHHSSFPMNFFIAFNNKKVQKTSILTHFRSFLPYLRPCRPHIRCQIQIILFYLLRLHHIVMSPSLHHSHSTILLHLLAKTFRKASILTHFGPICGPQGVNQKIFSKFFFSVMFLKE